MKRIAFLLAACLATSTSLVCGLPTSSCAADAEPQDAMLQRVNTLEAAVTPLRMEQQPQGTNLGNSIFHPTAVAAIDQQPAQPNAQSQDALLERLKALEAHVTTLQTELKQREADPKHSIVHPTAAVSQQLEQPVPEEEEWVSYDEMLTELRSMVWTKGEFRIVPYGVLWGSAIHASDRTAPGAYTIFVPSHEIEGENTFEIDTRRTRVGLNIAGPEIPMFGCAQSGGKIEIDFHGAFETVNKPGVLLRHAYAEIKDDRFKLLAGQTWDIISPLNPDTLNYSVGWGAGNIGYRRMQVRYERYINWSDNLLITAAGSMNQSIVSDFTSTSGVDPETSGWPVLEGRLGATIGPRGAGCSPITAGVSGHIGEQEFDFNTAGAPPIDDAHEKTWSINADLRIPITHRLGVQGEVFTGQNVGTFLGGIVQGVDLTRREGISTTGGWVNLWFDWTPTLHSYAGFSIDDPRNEDVTDGRTYNHYFFANGVMDVTSKMSLGVEVSSWKTMYSNLDPGNSVMVEFMGKYAF